jgi:SAM-dependent methyltransferase
VNRARVDLLEHSERLALQDPAALAGCDTAAVSAAPSYAKRFPPPERQWTQEYVDTHRALVSAALHDPELAGRLREGDELPEHYAIGFDERVVELPWLLAAGLRGRTLDAGSALNHAHILDHVLAQVDSLDVVTLEPEETSFTERHISYVYADLRELPYRDGWFRTVASISTLEHVGMDNRVYGVEQVRAADPEREVALALGELRRVLAPGGTLYVTVPYGAAEDHGWFRQYGDDDLERLIAAAEAPAALTIYAYGPEGWQMSDPERAGSATYRDFRADPSPVADLAAAARAVACLRFEY